MEESGYINQSDASVEYKIHRSKLRQWIAEGKLESYQSNRDMRQRLVKRSDIERLIGVRKAENPTTTPKPATMGASLEGDAPGQAPKRDRSTSFLDDVRPHSQMTNDELRARKATQPDYNLTADTINAYVASGTGEMTEDERFRIENDLPS